MAEDVRKLIQINPKFLTNTTVNIFNDPKLMNIHEQHEWQRYELFQKYQQLLPNKIISPITTQSSCSSIEFNDNHKSQLTSIEDNVLNDISEELRILIEQRLPDLSILHDESLALTNGTKFDCTINDILTSDGEFWVERKFSPENEQKFHQFINILSLFATCYESLKDVYIGQLVGLYYQSSWHRALVISKSEQISITKQANARVRLVDYGSSLYVHICQLKWLPEQFYLFPFKAIECVFSEAIKPTFSDTVRLTFKQLVLHKRLRAIVYDKDGTRLCILLKCKIDEGIINVYRYLRAYEHKSKNGRILNDGNIVQCLHNTINNHSYSFEQTILSNNSLNLTLPILSIPSTIKLTCDQIEIKREEIKNIYQEYLDNNHTMNLSNHILKDNKKISSSTQSTPFSSDTIITPISRLSFIQQ